MFSKMPFKLTFLQRLFKMGEETSISTSKKRIIMQIELRIFELVPFQPKPNPVNLPSSNFNGAETGTFLKLRYFTAAKPAPRVP